MKTLFIGVLGWAVTLSALENEVTYPSTPRLQEDPTPPQETRAPLSPYRGFNNLPASASDYEEQWMWELNSLKCLERLTKNMETYRTQCDQLSRQGEEDRQEIEQIKVAAPTGRLTHHEERL